MSLEYVTRAAISGRASPPIGQPTAAVSGRSTARPASNSPIATTRSRL